MKIIQKDITTVTRGIIFHQVNCKGVMGAGVARALADKFAGLEEAYKEYCDNNCYYDTMANKDSAYLLGKVFLYPVQDLTLPLNTREIMPTKLFIANVFGQDGFSRKGRQTSYDATANAFQSIIEAKSNDQLAVIMNIDLPLFFPFQMGCGLGGGRWDIYSSIIESYFGNRATICKL